MSLNDHMEEMEQHVELFEDYLAKINEVTSVRQHMEQLGEHYRVCREDECDVCVAIMTLRENSTLTEPKKLSKWWTENEQETKVVSDKEEPV